MSDDFAAYLAGCRERVGRALQERLPPTAFPAERLKSAMHYAVLNGGKRVRAALVYSAAEITGKPTSATSLDTIACAIEFMHAYSLIHDDLPAMDDDDLRRGQPTCHIAFDEATAILAGDALQTEAFALLACMTDCTPDIRCRLISEMANGAGVHGMVAGQDLDLWAENRDIDLDTLEQIHRHKTGALITASLRMGAIAAQATPAQLEALTQFGEAIGLAFQVHDDVLDVEGDTATLGKTQGADLTQHKATYPSLLGTERARELAKHLLDHAIAALDPLGPSAERLRQLGRFVVDRNH